MNAQSALKLFSPFLLTRAKGDGKRSWPLRIVALACFLACALLANAQTATTTVLTASSASAYSGTLLTLEAVVTAGSTSIVAGQIRFVDGAHTLATLQGVVQSNGSLKATLSARLTGSAVHLLTATYLGAPASTSRTAPSTSATVSVQTFLTGSFNSSVQLTEPSANTLTATVSTNGPVAPAGTVTFVDQSLGQTLGVETLPGAAVYPVFTTATWPTGPSPAAVVSADFNNDGLPDLAVVNSGDNSVSIFINRSDYPGQYLPAETYTVGPNPSAIVVADFNADGYLDLAVANSDNTITILFGGFPSNIQFKAVTIPAGVPVGSTLVAADMTGDGLSDLVFIASAVPNGSKGAIDILTNTAATPGTFATSPVVVDLSTPAHFLAAADFNGDGFTDLLVDNAVYLSTGVTGAFLPPNVLPYSCSCQATLAGTAVADLNADGIPDVVLMATGGTPGFFTEVVLSNASNRGQFLAPVVYPWSSTTAGPYTPIGLAIGDLNADGVPDIFTFGTVPSAGLEAQTPIATLNLGVSSALGTFSPMQTFTPPTGLNADFVLVDVNNDGIADLVFPIPADNNLATAISGLAVTVSLSNANIGGSGQQFITASYAANAPILSGSSPVLQLTGSGPAPTSILVVPSTLTEWTNLGLTVSVSVTEAVAPNGLASKHPGTPTGTVTLWDSSATGLSGGALSAIPTVPVQLATPFHHQWPAATLSSVTAIPVQLATASLDANGNAVFTPNPTLSLGEHSLSVTYSGDSAFAPGSSTATAIEVYGSSNAAVFNASPNPAQGPSAGAGQTTIAWNAPAGVTVVDVRVNAPNGPLLAEDLPSSSAPTGPWVTDGMVFYLQDVSGGKPLTSANTLAIIRMHLQPDIVFWANPNPIPVAPGAELGITSLIWSAPTPSTAITVGGTTGALFVTGGSTGVATTGLWVVDGTAFYLAGSQTGSNAIQPLDSVVVNLQPQVMFTASPSPISDSFLQNNQQTGSTTLSWSAPTSTNVRLRVGSPGGTIVANGTSTGSATASAEVTEGTTFYLEDASGGALDGTVLGSVIVNLKNPVQFTATPNPVTAINVVNGVETGTTTLQWSSPGRTSTAVFAASAFFVSTTPVATGTTSGSVTLTVHDGDQFLLEDTSGSSPIVIATVTIHLQHQVQFSATPNPAPIGFAQGAVRYAKTTLTWNVGGVSAVQINIGSPDGQEFVPGGPSGSAETGVWVTDGMTFYLQDVTGGKALTSANTLAVVTVRVL